jgi:Fe-S-cluster containining protein
VEQHQAGSELKVTRRIRTDIAPEGVRIRLDSSGHPKGIHLFLDLSEAGDGERDMATLGLLASAAARLMDEATSRMIEAERCAGRAPSCWPGCVACCRQLVTVSPPEALLLLDAIDAMETKARQDVLRRFEAAEQRLSEAGLVVRLSGLGDSALGSEDHYGLAREYYGLQIDCPLLANELCGAYPERPVLCREYFVTTPAAWCSDPFSRPVRSAPLAIPVRDVLAGASADLLRRDFELIALPLVFQWGRDRCEGRWRRWSRRRLAETFVGHLESAMTLQTQPAADDARTATDPD